MNLLDTSVNHYIYYSIYTLYTMYEIYAHATDIFDEKWSKKMYDFFPSATE